MTKLRGRTPLSRHLDRGCLTSIMRFGGARDLTPGPHGLEALGLRDQLAEDQGQNAAVVQVAYLGLVVDPSTRGEGRDPARLIDRPDLDQLTWFQRVEPVHRVALLAGQTEQV